MERRGGIRSWFVEPYLQVRLGLFFVILNTCFALIFGLVVGYFFWDVYQAMAVYFHFNNLESSQVLAKLQFPIFVACGVLVCFVAASVILAAKYTHSLYGPMVGIMNFVQRLNNGEDVEPLQLRDKDQLKDLADELNKLAGCEGASSLLADIEMVTKFVIGMEAGEKTDELSLPVNGVLADLASRLRGISQKSHSCLPKSG